MGRSVISTHDATAVAYRTFGPDEESYREMYDDTFGEDEDPPDFEQVMWAWWDEDSQYQFDDLVSWIREGVQRLWPSFEDANEWHCDDDEQHVILTNAHSEISISEYGGMIAISLSPYYDRAEYWRDPEPELGEHWRKQISAKFLSTFGEYSKIGTFSNGESVYQKKA